MDITELGHRRKAGKANGLECDIRTGSLAGGWFAQTSQVLSGKSLPAKAGPFISTKEAPEEKGPTHSELQGGPWKATASQNPSFALQNKIIGQGTAGCVLESRCCSPYFLFRHLPLFFT